MEPAETFSAQPPCNCVALRKASRRLSQIYDAALAPAGLKSTQFSILREIGRRAEAPTIGELAEHLVMDQSTMGQNLKPLQREGLIVLAADKKDGRCRRAKLTAKGRAKLKIAGPLWIGIQARFEAGFGKADAAALRAVLLNIANGDWFEPTGQGRSSRQATTDQ